MSSDKRRRARVQGGWAGPSTGRCTVTVDKTNISNAKLQPQGKSIPQNQHSQDVQGTADCETGSNHKNAPSWLGKNVDVPERRTFVYEKPVEEYRQKPDMKMINKPGVYDLSVTDNGVSRIRLFHSFIDLRECEDIFNQLFHELPWQQKSDIHDGQSYLQPRLTAWYGDLSYKYSGATQEANTQWHPLLRELAERLESNTGFTFNSVLVNLYRDCHDSVSWHCDNEPILGTHPVIASLSFGDTRMFELRKIPPPEENGDYTYMEHVRVPLDAGCLLIMEGATQLDWQHQVPKEYHDRKPRINLTYRQIQPTHS